MKKNKKGFTLVELLAVIVVLAIIMIIAIPQVMESMNAAKKNSFKIYAQKVLNTAISKYQTATLTGEAKKTCYTVDELMGNGKGNYVGSVKVDGVNPSSPDFKVYLSDGSYLVSGLNYNELEGTNAITSSSTAASTTCGVSA